MPATKKAYKIICNDSTFYFDEKELDGIDLVKRSPTEFNCIMEHRSANATIMDTDLANKKFKIGIEGELFTLQIKDELDQLIEMMSMGQAGTKKHINIKAPMPGLVLEIAIKDGQEVNGGDKILILEAMKMENILVIPVSAVIKKILVSKGQVVERGQVLVELE